MNITITDAAATKVAELLESEMGKEANAKALRIYIQGGGCSGFQYGFAFEEDFSEDDQVIEIGDATFVIDPMSGMYLNEATIDYITGLAGEHFSINNPNAKTTCGCGSSFGA